MLHLHLNYLLCLVTLVLFGGAFFTSQLYLPKIKIWKSKQLFNESKVYRNVKIGNEGGLLLDGVRKARIAHLMNPLNVEIHNNYLEMLFRTNPEDAIMKWSVLLAQSDKESNIAEKELLLKRTMSILSNDKMEPHVRKVALASANTFSELLSNTKNWNKLPENQVILAEFFAETGNPLKALKIINNLLEKEPLHPQATFLLTRLTVSLKDSSGLIEVAKALNELTTQQNRIGVEAIKHITLINVLEALSEEYLQICIERLQSNRYSEPIDFLRIYALLYAKRIDPIQKKKTISDCFQECSKSDFFNPTNTKSLLIFANWLARIGAFSEILEFIPASKAKLNEDLFKIRMNALANLNELEKIHFEVNNAPTISSRWRLIIEARVFSLERNFKKARDSLERLLVLVGDDPRLVISVCEYLEKTKDIISLSHILEKLIDKPIHQKFALQKLLQHRSASADLEQILSWLSKILEKGQGDFVLENACLYLKILNPKLPTPSKEVEELLRQSYENMSQLDSPGTRITNALAHLRNKSPDKALVALGKPMDWRNWLSSNPSSRPAWSFIASQIYRMNRDTEKARLLGQNIDFAKMDRAERESLAQLFPNQVGLLK